MPADLSMGLVKGHGQQCQQACSTLLKPTVFYWVFSTAWLPSLSNTAGFGADPLQPPPPHGLHHASGLVAAEAMKADTFAEHQERCTILLVPQQAVGMLTGCCCHGCCMTAAVTVSRTMNCTASWLCKMTMLLQWLSDPLCTGMLVI